MTSRLIFIVAPDFAHGNVIARSYGWKALAASRFTNDQNEDIRIVRNLGELPGGYPPGTRLVTDERFNEREQDEREQFLAEVERMHYTWFDPNEPVEGDEVL